MTVLKRPNDINNRVIGRRISSTSDESATVGPLGGAIRLEDLPPPDTKRWVARRKAEVVAAVRGGLLTLTEACKRYNLSEDEYRSWERLFEKHGMKGLHTTRTQAYRNIDARHRSADQHA